MYAENILRLLPPKLRQELSLPKLAEDLLNLNVSGINNIIGTKSEILLFTDINITDLRKALKSLKLKNKTNSNEYSLPICFSKGADWSNVEKTTGISKTKYINQILKSSLSLSMYGFLPGFMYLDGLPKDLQIPRMSKHSKKVNQGSFALGGPYAGIYNIESPGGWNVIANCPIQLFNSKSILKPFLKIGDTFTLKKITVSEWKDLKSENLDIKDYN